MSYLKNKPSIQFLILNVKDEKGFKKLAEFLGKQTINDKFPHYNKTKALVENKNTKESRSLIKMVVIQ